MYYAKKAQEDAQAYRDKLAKEQFDAATRSELFQTTMENIKINAQQGLNSLIVYPIHIEAYDNFYDAYPDVLKPVLATSFNQEQLDVLHAFEQLGYKVFHTTNAGYKPKNMPSIANGGWVYPVDTMTIAW